MRPQHRRSTVAAAALALAISIVHAGGAQTEGNQQNLDLPKLQNPYRTVNGNVWVVDAGVVDGVKGNQITKYSPDGKILLELGKAGVRGTNESRDLFNEPSDLVIAPNGDVYVADGHINTKSNRRIVHLTKDG